MQIRCPADQGPNHALRQTVHLRIVSSLSRRRRQRELVQHATSTTARHAARRLAAASLANATSVDPRPSGDAHVTRRISPAFGRISSGIPPD